MTCGARRQSASLASLASHTRHPRPVIEPESTPLHASRSKISHTTRSANALLCVTQISRSLNFRYHGVPQHIATVVLQRQELPKLVVRDCIWILIGRMPSKTEQEQSSDQTSPKTRNTINQRQSRARRKTYVSELEAKVRFFESSGVQASREVQVAAQQVVEDNRRLRWILQQRFGVDERELALLLSDQSQQVEVGRGQEAARCPRCGTNVPIPQAQDLSQAQHEGSGFVYQQSQLPSPPYTEPESQSRYAKQEPNHVSMAVPLQNSDQHSEYQPQPKNTMLCEEAAAIIASMRGSIDDTQEVCHELGCPPNQTKCNVDSGRVMSLLDR